MSKNKYYYLYKCLHNLPRVRYKQVSRFENWLSPEDNLTLCPAWYPEGLKSKVTNKISETFFLLTVVNDNSFRENCCDRIVDRLNGPVNRCLYLNK